MAKKKMVVNIIILIGIVFVVGLIYAGSKVIIDKKENMINNKKENMINKEESMVELEKSNYKKAYLAGGCFWCIESAFEGLEGVASVISGYSGGEEIDPSYEEVSSGKTGHKESVEIIYDSNIVSYRELVEYFFTQIDPTDSGGQFVDRGSQYSSAIFVQNEEERKIAEEVIRKIEESGRFEGEIVVGIEDFKNFYKAEEYHQDYYKKSTINYKLYEAGSGRKGFKEEYWSDIEDEKINEDESNGNDMESEKENNENEEVDLKESLTPIQYKVTQLNGTEPAFDNEYWDEKRDGIYVDLISGEVLFSSLDKFDSGTGWPSFTKPLVEENIVLRDDRKLFFKRTEVRSKEGNSHLGHVFNDAPKEFGGIRYCMNSASLKFISKKDMEKEGYGEYLELFE